MPAPRPRFRVIGKFASAYMPKEYQKWQAEAADRINAGLFGVSGGPRFAGPVAVELAIACTKPKTSKLAYPKPDVDNFAKAVLDAITKDGRVWADDTQVVQLIVSKRWAYSPEDRGVLIDIQEL